jgi:UDP-glucose 4-epimerase
MRIAITGIAGFLGSHVAEAMLARGHEVIGVDNMLGGYRDNVPPDADFYGADCCHFERMMYLMRGVDVVYHCAATAYEGLSVFSPALVSRNIVDASVSVFSAAIAQKVKRIVHCSSMARYGTQTTPYKESMRPMPQDPYGIAKVCAEQMLKNLSDVHGIEHVIAVPHNIIGPRQKYDDPYRNVAAIMMNRLMQDKPAVIYGDGTQQRCFSFVADCIDCLIKLGDLDDKRVVGQVINIGPDEGAVTINELHAVISTILRKRIPPLYMPGRPQEVHIAICSSDKARDLLGYKTVYTLPMGLTEMAEWMKARGPKPFSYHLPLEIVTEKTPTTWSEQVF